MAPLPAVGALVTAAHRSRCNVWRPRGDLWAALTGPPPAVPGLITQDRRTGGRRARTRGELGIAGLLCAGRFCGPPESSCGRVSPCLGHRAWGNAIARLDAPRTRIDTVGSAPAFVHTISHHDRDSLAPPLHHSRYTVGFVLLRLHYITLCLDGAEPLRLPIVLHDSRRTEAAVGGRQRERELPLWRSSPQREAVVTTSRENALPCGSEGLSAMGHDRRASGPCINSPHPVPKLLFALPPLPRPGCTPGPPAACRDAPVPTPSPSSRGCGSFRVGRVQRAALEARLWSARRAAVMEHPPPPRSTLLPEHSLGRFSPCAESLYPSRRDRSDGAEAVGGGVEMSGACIGSPVTVSPVAHRGVVEVRGLHRPYGRRQDNSHSLQPAILAPSRQSDDTQQRYSARGSAMCPSGASSPTPSSRHGLGVCTPVSSTIHPLSPATGTTAGGVIGEALSRRGQRPSTMATTSNRRLRMGVIARTRVPCSRGCGHTFGNRSGMLACVP